MTTEPPCPICQGTLVDPVGDPCIDCDHDAWDRARSLRPLPGPAADLRVIVGLLRLTGTLADQWGHDYDDGRMCRRGRPGCRFDDPEEIGKDLCMLARLLEVTADRLMVNSPFGEFRGQDHNTWGGELRALAGLADGELTLPDDDNPDAPVVVGG